MPPFCGLALLALWFGAISPCLGAAGLTGLAAGRAGNQFIPPQANDAGAAVPPATRQEELWSAALGAE